MRNDFVKWVKQAVIVAAVALFALSVACRSTQQNLNKPPEAPPPTATQPTQSPFNVVDSKVIERNSPFDHSRAEHQTKTKDCAFCHQRVDNEPVLDFKKNGPHHNACIECHQKDFTSTSSKMCEVCHKVPVDAAGTLIQFPVKQDEFGIKAFSHKTHMDPAKMKDQSAKGEPRCQDCHRFDGAGLQASFPKHPDCFSCHAHESGGKFANCDTCHTPKAQAVSYSAGAGAAFSQYNFRHSSQHLKAGDCSRCHKTTEVAAGEPRSDISPINTARGQRHHSTCWQCHVQAREPVCTKCHKASLPF
jgi:hypothetical protein